MSRSFGYGDIGLEGLKKWYQMDVSDIQSIRAREQVFSSIKLK